MNSVSNVSGTFDSVNSHALEKMRSPMYQRSDEFNHSPETGDAFLVTRIAYRIDEAVLTKDMYQFGCRSPRAPHAEQSEEYIPEY